METKFDVGEEVYLKCKVVEINASERKGTKYIVTLPEGNFSGALCLEADLEKVSEAPKTYDYNITLTIPNVSRKNIVSIYDKLESVMTDIVGSDEWDMICTAIGQEKDNGTGN